MTGFRSRKIERRKAAQAEITKLAREAKVAERAERKEAKQTELELLESRSGGILPNPKKKLKSAEAHLALAHDSGDHDDGDSDSGSAAESSAAPRTASTASVVQFDDEEDEDLVTVTTTILGGGSVNVRLLPPICIFFLFLPGFRFSSGIRTNRCSSNFNNLMLRRR